MITVCVTTIFQLEYLSNASVFQAPYSVLLVHSSSSTYVYDTPYGGRDKSVLIQGNGQIRLCNVQRISESLQMKVSSSCPHTELVQIKSIHRDQHRRKKKKSLNSEQFSTKHQNIPGHAVTSNRAEASVQIMTLSSKSRNRK